MPNGAHGAAEIRPDVDITSLHYGQIEKRPIPDPANLAALGFDPCNPSVMDRDMIAALERLQGAISHVLELHQRKEARPEPPPANEEIRWASWATWVCADERLFPPAQRTLLIRLANNPSYEPEGIENRSLKVLIRTVKAVESVGDQWSLTARGRALIAALETCDAAE